MKLILPNPFEYEHLDFFCGEIVAAGIPLERAFKNSLNGIGLGNAVGVMLDFIDSLQNEDNQQLYNYCSYCDSTVDSLIYPFHDAFLAYASNTVLPRIRQGFEVSKVAFIDDGIEIDIHEYINTDS